MGQQLYAPQKEQRTRTSDMIGADTDMPLPAGEENHCTERIQKRSFGDVAAHAPLCKPFFGNSDPFTAIRHPAGTRPQYRVYLPGYPIAEFPGQQTAALFHVEKEES